MIESCFSCGADLSGLSSCPGCDLPQTPEVFALHGRLLEAERRTTLFRSLFAIGIIAGLVLGAVIGVLTGTPRAEAIRDREIAEVLEKPMPKDLVNDMFMRMIDERLHLGLRGWIRHTSGAIIFEMSAPTAEQPSLWERFTQDEKKQIAEFFAASYTAVLFRTGNPVNVETEGHPAIALRYYGTESPVAVRLPDGKVQIFPSPLR